MTTSARREATAEGVPTGLLIDGEWREGRAGRIPVEDPATGEVVAEVADASPQDALEALAAAVRAQRAWAASPPRDRAAVLRRAFEAMLERRERLARLLTLEMGKPIAESRYEVDYAAEYLAWFSEEVVRIDGRYSVAPDGAGRVLVMQHPVGPCLVITPWNFPLVMATRAVAPALAAGCTVVLKPSRLTPLTSLMLCALLEECGTPAGVVNVVASSRSRPVIGPLLTHPGLRKLTFTGSTDVGRGLLAQSAGQVLRVSLELGGNAPFVVFADADLEAAVDGAVGAKMRNAGQACTSANRILVAREIAPAFIQAFTERVAALRLGPGNDPATELGPLVDAEQRDRLDGLVRDARASGATIETGGEVPDGPGYFYPPTVITRIPDAARVLREEIFGPVAPIQVFATEEEAVRLANDTEYGLAAYVYTEDFHRALRVVEAMETGMVALNQGRVSNPMAPFGGVKHSGLGRAGGPEAMAEYLETKYVAVRHP